MSVVAGKPQTVSHVAPAARATRSFLVKRRVRFWLFVLLTLLVALVAIGAAASYTLYRSAEDHYVGLAIPLRSATRDVLYQMEREETGVRGYVITADRDSLDSYFEGRRGVQVDLARIGGLAQGRPELAARLAIVRRQVVGLHGFYDRLIVFVADGKGIARARREVLDGEVRADNFRRSAQALQDEADRLALATRHDQRVVFRRTLVALVAAGALAIAIALALLARLPNRLRTLYASEEEARWRAEEGANAARALAHVTDAVALVDDDGVVRFWNQAAALLFQLEPSAAIGSSATRAVPDYDRLVTAAERRERFVHTRIDGDERWLAPSISRFEGGSVLTVCDSTAGYVLERTRADFVATASHELRTPLTAVYGGARTLIAHRESLERGQQDRLLRMIEQESEHLVEIVDQLLISAQLDRGALTVETTEVDVAELCRTVVDSAAMRALDRNLVLLQMPTEIAPISTDDALLRQVLVNLVENAIKYSEEGDRVDVLVSDSPSSLQIEVVDEGIGIPPAERDRIFEKFYRLDAAMQRGVGGSGLGLYISKEIVERLGGRLTVESTPDVGSRFTLSLPRA